MNNDQIDANELIAVLQSKIGQMAVENAVLQTQINKLTEQLNKGAENKDDND